MIGNNAQYDRVETVTVTKVDFPARYHFPAASSALQEPPAIFVGKQGLVNYGTNVSMLAGDPSFGHCLRGTDMLDTHPESELTEKQLFPNSIGLGQWKALRFSNI